MKNKMKTVILALGLMMAAIAGANAQGKVDEDRMARDMEVSRNVLSTMMRQQFGKRNFFPMEVEAAYLPGFGVTFRLPNEFAMWMISGDQNIAIGFGDANSSTVTINSGGSYGGNYQAPRSEDDCVDCPAIATAKAPRAYVKGFQGRKKSNDSLRNTYNQAIVQASKDFIADYGDMLSQLAANERIVITNKSEGSRNRGDWLYGGGRVYLSMEALKSDLQQFKQGKLSREQFFAKIKTVNSETTEDLSPDLELLSSIFNRLYRPDLSKTYYLQEDIYYERLKDYGVIYDMHAYSSSVVAEDYLANGKIRTLYEMPTLQLSGIDREERLKHVKELYPAFERNIVDDVLEYSKTLKSLADNELVVFNVKLTECKGCNIPASLEISFKESVLKDYSSGKLTKEAALAKGTVKKGPMQ